MLHPNNVLIGTVHGKIIRLETECGLPEGMQVYVSLEPWRTADAPRDEAGREALERAAGAWAEDGVELDQFLEWNRRERNVDDTGAIL
jgi:hypothetical protein